MSWDMTGTLLDAKITDSSVTIETSDGTWSFTPYGDCCANAYVHDPAEAQADFLALKGQRIIKAEETDVPVKNFVDGKKYEFEDWDNDSGNVRDVHFYTLQCEKYGATITLYVDHNGYYGGSLQGGKQ